MHQNIFRCLDLYLLGFVNMFVLVPGTTPSWWSTKTCWPMEYSTPVQQGRYTRLHAITIIIYIPTARHTMNSFAPNGVHHLLNAVSSEYLFSCNEVCNWSSELNGAKTHVLRWTHLPIMVFITRWTQFLRNTLFSCNDVCDWPSELNGTKIL